MDNRLGSLRLGFTIIGSILCTLTVVYFYQQMNEPCEDEYEIPNYIKIANLRQDSPCAYLRVPGTLDTMLSSWQDFIVALSYVNKEKWVKVSKKHKDLGIQPVRSMSILPTKLKIAGNQVPTIVRVLQISPPNATSSIRFMETAMRFVKTKSFHLVPVSSWLSPAYIEENGEKKRVEIEDSYTPYMRDLQKHELLENVFPMRLPLDQAAEVLECSGVTFHIVYISAREKNDFIYALDRFQVFVEEGGFIIGDMMSDLTQWTEMFDAVQRLSKTQGGIEKDSEFWSIKIRNAAIKK